MSDKTASSTQLNRQLGLLSAVVLVISAIIGTGVFKKVAPMLVELQSPKLVMLCWIVAGLVSLMGALSNAEVASLLADSGGDYVYFKKIYGPVFAFFYGWSCFAVMRSASIASIAFVFAESLNSVTGLGGGEWAIKGVTIGLILLLTLLNYRGLKLGETVSLASTIGIFAGIAAILVIGFFFSKGSLATFSTDATAGIFPSLKEKFAACDKIPMSSSGLLSAFFTASLAAFWAYEGWNNLGYIGGEVKNPSRNIPLALGIGVLTVIGTYLLLNFVYLWSMPADQFITQSLSAKCEGRGYIAAVEVLRNIVGYGGALFISLFILVTTFNCTNSTILMASRVPFAMAREGLFFKKAAEITRFSTPGWALIFQAAWASGLVLIGTFDKLTDMIIFASFMYYGATALGVFILRRRMPDAPRAYKVPLYPIVPALFILFCVVLIVNTLISKPDEALMGLGLIATGIPFYFYWNSKKA